jgi:uncharacterized PurR-regulated membrane protein YhhQ (DUF165 family)
VRTTYVPGRGRRRAFALAIGLVVALVVCITMYVGFFAKARATFEVAGDMGRVWWLIAVASLVAGTIVQSFVVDGLEKRARRIYEDTRIPRARAR